MNLQLLQEQNPDDITIGIKFSDSFLEEKSQEELFEVLKRLFRPEVVKPKKVISIDTYVVEYYQTINWTDEDCETKSASWDRVKLDFIRDYKMSKIKSAHGLLKELKKCVLNFMPGYTLIKTSDNKRIKIFSDNQN